MSRFYLEVDLNNPMFQGDRLRIEMLNLLYEVEGQAFKEAAVRPGRTAIIDRNGEHCGFWGFKND